MNIKFTYLFSIVFIFLPLCGQKSSSMIHTLITYPPEVSLETDIVPDRNGMLQLDEERIEALRMQYEKNFNKRAYLKYIALAAQIGCIGLALHNYGLLNAVLPDNLTAKLGISAPTNALAKTVAEQEQKIADMLKWQTNAEQKFPLLKNIKPASGFLSWLWGGVQSMSSMVALSLCWAKLAQVSSYVEAQPSFAWFFSKHSFSDRVDVLRKSIKAITDFNIPDDYSLEYHTRSIAPALQSIAHNIEELIAFMEYYFETIDQDLLHEQGMNLQSRYLFNISNDFFKKIHAALHNQNQNHAAVAILDDFKTDLVASIKKCQFFEKDFIDIE